MQLIRPLRLGFPSAPFLQKLNLAAYHNSLARSTKSTWSLIAPIACKHQVSGSFSLPSRGPFHLSLTVLFSIGHLVVFRLGGWAPRLQTGFHVSGPTLVSVRLLLPFDYGAFTLFGGTFQSSSSRYPHTLSQIHNPEPLGLGLASFPFARRYLGNRFCFLFLRVLRCFTSPRSLRTPIDSVHDHTIFSCVVPQFGNPRVAAYLQLTVAYRS